MDPLFRTTENCDLEAKISRLLINLGITARLKGYGYLITGIKMAIMEPEGGKGYPPCGSKRTYTRACM